MRLLNSYEARNNVANNIACPTSNDSDQPAQMCRLIGVIALRSIGCQIPKFSFDDRQRFCLECVNAQADLSLRLAHKQF